MTMPTVWSNRLKDWDKLSNLPNNTIWELALKQNTSEKWQANWYASLDWTWKVPTSQLPWWMGNWDVVWPNSSTDNAIARYSWTTWKLIKNSSATIDDLWNISATNLSWTNTWDETKATIESKLTWDISSHTHDWRYYTETETDTLLWNKVDKTITLTINWTTYDLSANRSWTISWWGLNYIAVTSNQSISPSNFYWVTCTTSDITLTLADWTSIWENLTIKKIDNTPYNITISGNIEQDWSIIIDTQFESIDLFWNWTYYLIK